MPIKFCTLILPFWTTCDWVSVPGPRLVGGRRQFGRLFMAPFPFYPSLVQRIHHSSSYFPVNLCLNNLIKQKQFRNWLNSVFRLLERRYINFILILFFLNSPQTMKWVSATRWRVKTISWRIRNLRKSKRLQPKKMVRYDFR